MNARPPCDEEPRWTAERAALPIRWCHCTGKKRGGGDSRRTKGAGGWRGGGRGHRPPTQARGRATIHTDGARRLHGWSAGGRRARQSRGRWTLVLSAAGGWSRHRGWGELLPPFGPRVKRPRAPRGVPLCGPLLLDSHACLMQAERQSPRPVASLAETGHRVGIGAHRRTRSRTQICWWVRSAVGRGFGRRVSYRTSALPRLTVAYRCTTARPVRVFDGKSCTTKKSTSWLGTPSTAHGIQGREQRTVQTAVAGEEWQKT